MNDRVLKSHSPGDLAFQVNEHLKEGWRTKGKPFRDKGRFCQAVELAEAVEQEVVVQLPPPSAELDWMAPARRRFFPS